MDTPTTAAPVIGSKLGGGFFAGRFFIGAIAYGLIVSSKAEGDIKPMAWNKSTKMVEGAISYNDGRANTLAMVKAGSPLAKKVTALRIGGHDDWYLPSRIEALLMREPCESPSFKEGGPEAFSRELYWTSTQCAGDDGYAWYQSFYLGYQNNTHKSSQLLARAVRRVKI